MEMLILIPPLVLFVWLIVKKVKKVGDGWIFVSDIEKTIRIKNKKENIID